MELSGTLVVAAAVGLVLAVVAVVVLAAALRRSRIEAERVRAEAARASEELLRRIEALESPAPTAGESTDPSTFVITAMGSDGAPVEGAELPAERISGRFFADIVLRESVVKAASWAHGARVALSAENRHRVKFHVKQETKRAGKQRREDVKEALRLYYAQRDEATGDAPAALTSSAPRLEEPR